MTTKTYDRHTAKFLARVAENIPEMSTEVMQGWIENPHGLQKFLAGLNPNQEVSDISNLAINYTLTLDQMIALGRYDWKNDNITAKRFPIVGSGVTVVEHKLFHFDRIVSSDEAERLIEADGYQPAKIEHLLAYGAANPEDQRKFPIVALGSVARLRGFRSVPYLYGFGSGRGLGLVWRNDVWLGNYRFLAVRNSVP